MLRYIVHHVLDDIQASVLRLEWRVHQDLGNPLLPYPFSSRSLAGIHLLQIRLTVLMNHHVRARQGVYLPVVLDAEELGALDRLRLVGIWTTGLAYHIGHGLDEESPGAAGGIQNAVVLTDLDDTVHEVCDVLRREHLSGITLLLVPIELIEEDAHHIFSAPGIGVQAIGDLGDPAYELGDHGLDMLLLLLVVAVDVEVHLDASEDLREQTELLVLLQIAVEFLVQGVEDGVMKLGIPHAFDHQCTIALCYKGAGGEYHPMVQVLDPEINMESVVNPHGQAVYLLLVDALDLEQREIVSDILEDVRTDPCVFVAVFEHADGFTVVQDAHDVRITVSCDANILQEFIDLGLTELSR